MEERKVKGTMLLDFVKMIKANKSLDWNKYLRPKDWDIINTIVLPAKWYPLDFYKRCSMAGFMLLAKGDLKGARISGHEMGKRLFQSTYKSIVQVKDPMRALNQFVLSFGSFFNFSMLKLEKVGPSHARVHHNYDAHDEGSIPFCHQMMGIFESLLEAAGGRQGKVDLLAKQWEGAAATTFDIKWE